MKYKIEVRMDVIIEDAGSLQDAVNKAIDKAWNPEITHHVWAGKSHAIQEENFDGWDYIDSK